MVFPNIHVSTEEAYGGVKIRKRDMDLREQLKLPIDHWKNVIKNDFETSIFPKYKIIEQAKLALYKQGAIYVSMTGSGSAVYGIFHK